MMAYTYGKYQARINKKGTRIVGGSRSGYSSTSRYLHKVGSTAKRHPTNIQRMPASMRHAMTPVGPEPKRIPNVRKAIVSHIQKRRQAKLNKPIPEHFYYKPPGR
jgi:hypothetical protein